MENKKIEDNSFVTHAELEKQLGDLSSFREEDKTIIKKISNEFDTRGVKIKPSRSDDTRVFDEALKKASGLNVPLFVSGGEYIVDDLVLLENSKIIMADDAIINVKGNITNNKKNEGKIIRKVKGKVPIGTFKLFLEDISSLEMNQEIVIQNGGWYSEKDWINDSCKKDSLYVRYQLATISEINTLEKSITLDSPLNIELNPLNDLKATVEVFNGTQNNSIINGTINFIGGSLRLENVINLVINKVHFNFSDAKQDALFFERIFNSEIINCFANLANNNFLWLARGCDNVVVENNIINAFNSFKRDATILVYYGCNNIFVKNNKLRMDTSKNITQQAQFGIIIHTDSRNCEVSDNDVINYKYGIGSYFGCYDVIFKRNFISKCGIGMISHGSKNEIIKDNTVVDCNDAFMIPYKFGVHDMTFEGNKGSRIQNGLVISSFFTGFVKSNIFTDFLVGIRSTYGGNFEKISIKNNIFKTNKKESSAILIAGIWKFVNISENEIEGATFFLNNTGNILYSIISKNISSKVDYFSKLSRDSVYNKIYENIVNSSTLVFSQDATCHMNDYNKKVYNFTDSQNIKIATDFEKNVNIGFKVHKIDLTGCFVKVGYDFKDQLKNWKAIIYDMKPM